jgi:hypothetical protein
MVLERDTHVRFVSTTSMPLFPHRCCDGSYTRVLDCRHGRVLVQVFHGSILGLVWDPVTGDRPKPDMDWYIYSAVVLCAADGCDHLDCHGGPFRVVVFAGRASNAQNVVDGMLASVYSSETGSWSVPVCHGKTCDFFAQRRHALVGEAVYFTARPDSAIVKYDLSKDRLSMFDPPIASVCVLHCPHCDGEQHFAGLCLHPGFQPLYVVKEGGYRRSCRMGTI